MQRRHGDTVYWLPEEQRISVSAGAGPVPGGAPQAEAVFIEAAVAEVQQEREFRFGKMLRDLKPAHPGQDEQYVTALKAAFKELGGKMLDPRENGPEFDNSKVAAGYTYLGQLINHDLTFDPTAGLPDNETTEEERERGRRPALDLSCVYGTGPQTPTYRPLYDGARLKLGRTTATFADDSNFVLECDLPRQGPESPTPRQAVIPDARNDDSLTLAQLHVALMRFHNAVVRLLAGQGVEEERLFDEARRIVVQHYQWVVLNEFLQALVKPSIYRQLLANRRTQFFSVESLEELCLPLEFAGAAFRAGHSMVRNVYSWNRVFQGPKAPRLERLFAMTGRDHMEATSKKDTLPTRWVIDWRRFFDFSAFDGAPHEQLNRARKIDTLLANGLHNFPALPGPPPKSPSLAVLDLIQGHSLGLPSGQDAAQALRVPVLKHEQVVAGPHGDTLIKHGFDTRTPLWYYILKEAEAQSDPEDQTGAGERLGPIGSIIVAETIYEVLRWSPHSILREENWQPREELCRVKGGPFGMAELLHFALGNEVSLPVF